MGGGGAVEEGGDDRTFANGAIQGPRGREMVNNSNKPLRHPAVPCNSLSV